MIMRIEIWIWLVYMEKIWWKRKVDLIYMLIDPTKDVENLTAQSIYSFEIWRAKYNSLIIIYHYPYIFNWELACDWLKLPKDIKSDKLKIQAIMFFPYFLTSLYTHCPWTLWIFFRFHCLQNLSLILIYYLKCPSTFSSCPKKLLT